MKHKKMVLLVGILICIMLCSTTIVTAKQDSIWDNYRSHGGMSFSVFLYEFQQIPDENIDYQQAAIISYFLSINR